MAQYFQVTSLEELHKLYPNLQLDNLEGIPCMIQDDQVAQYTDGQGQQIIAAIEQTGMQLPQNTVPSQQCTTAQQQSQFVVHQPTQYVIQQMDKSEPQTSTVQYIPQRQQIASPKEDISIVQFKDQNVKCINRDIGSEESSLQHCVVKQEGNQQQYLPGVQQVLQQPIQIHQQIQAVDVGGNILVLQNQEQQDLVLKHNKSSEIISNSPEKQQQQLQQSQPQRILIHSHQQQKPPQLIAHKQIIQKSENSQECVQQQILQNRHLSQSGGQQQQLMHQSQQQIIQPLQYFNQVTVIDNFSPPRAVTIEHQTVSNENMGQQQQMQGQIHQYRPKKNMQQTNLPAIIQQPQILIPQRFEMSSPPPFGSNISQNKKRVTPQDLETSSSPVFIVQKVDSPFLVRQNPTKMRFQSSQPGNEKINENSYQSFSTQSDQVGEHLTENQQIVSVSSTSIQPGETQQKMNVTGQIPQSQSSKCSDKSLSFGQIKIGIVEQPGETGSSDQINKLKVCTPLSVRTPVHKIKTVEQQTESSMVCDGKETSDQEFQRYTNAEPQPRTVPGISCSGQSPVEIQNQIQISGRGRGVRGPSPRGYQFLPRGRGIQVQTSPRLPSLERGGICKRLKSPRGGSKVGRGGWMCNGPDQRQVPVVRGGLQHTSQNINCKIETSQASHEVLEEARMVVLLINGEKKIVKIPCSQNILLGQILQQAGLSLTTPTPITVEQAVDNFDHLILKNNLGSNQQVAVGVRPSNTTQVISVPNSPGTPRSIIATIQQRPRGQISYTPQTSNVGIIRHRLHFVGPRMSSPTFSGSSVVTSNASSESSNGQSQSISNSTQPSTPAKEESRFVPGFIAICPFCGISSLDFNKCIRCRRKLPENVKSQSIFSLKKKKEKASSGSEKIDDCKSDSDEKQSGLSTPEDKEKHSSLQGKKPKPCIKKKKLSDEPAEILILSSDEEEDSKIKKISLTASAISGLKKEPVYTDILSEAEMNNILKESSLNEDLMKNAQPGSFTTLQCRTIRVGSYKVQPKERLFVSSRGIRIVINSLKNENATIIIPTTDILKVLIHFGKQIPVIFIYPLPKIGCHIRNLLGMDNKMGPYYDPASSQEETHKRITLLLEKITDDNKIAINKIFGPDKLEELSEKEANEILVRASPVEMQNTALGKQSDDVKKIMIYPPPPEKGGITLNNQDYACLGEDQFLNDVIIDFYLKYLMLKVLSPADRNRTHVFSTFFYKRLTTKPKTLRKNDPENDPKLSPAEKRHMRVKGWTKQVNLFEKDFIIVPINEHSHWFLAIICFPGLTGPVRFSDNTPVEPEEKAPKKSTESVQIGNTTITHIIKTDGNMISLEMDSGSDRDEAEGDQDDLHPSSDDEGSEQVEEEASSLTSVQIPLLAPASQPQVAGKDSKSKLAKRKSFREPIKQPCILIFDSLAGASRVRVVATLRDYLKIEYKKKMGQDRDFSKDTIKGAVPKVPQQNNFTDCGLYVLQYVESFFQDPLHDFKLPLKYLQDWFPEEVVSSKRQKLASLIRSLMEEQGIKVEEIGLPVLTFTNGSSAGDEQPRMEDEEVEDEDELNEEDEEDEEEMLRNRVRISGFDNEDDEDLNLEEEDEIDDDEDEDDEDEEVDFDEDEELEVGEIPRRWLARTNNCCSELQPSVKRVFKTNALVAYEATDSEDDDETLPQNSVVINKSQGAVSGKNLEIRELSESDQSLISENRKTVPLTEFQDFESQISCTTIERNLDGKNNENDMIFSEEETDEGQDPGAVDEVEPSFDSSSVNTKVLTDSLNQSLEKRTSRPNELLVKDEKTMEVTDIIKKLVNDKNITISRKEDELNSSLFRKHLDVKKVKVKDCDKGEEIEKATSPSSPSKTNSATYKRPYQTLKSVRIQKKTERNLELCSKRQKVDER